MQKDAKCQIHAYGRNHTVPHSVQYIATKTKCFALGEAMVVNVHCRTYAFLQKDLTIALLFVNKLPQIAALI